VAISQTVVFDISMIEQYKFTFSIESLVAPIRGTNGNISLIPDWEMLEGERVDHRIVNKVQPIRGASNCRFGLICHAYTITPAFLEKLSHISINYSPSAIVFTVDTVEKQSQLQAFIEELAYIPAYTKILVLPNLGRDVITFWHALRDIAPYADVFLKLHWKKSPHLDTYLKQPNGLKAGDVWNQDIYRTLIPSSVDELQDILYLIDSGQVVCVYPRPWPPISDIHWYSEDNLIHATQLLAALSITQTTAFIPLIYPSGNMFYGSVSFFMKYTDQILANIDAPIEPIPSDGTVLHAIERIYTYIAACQGYDVAVLYPLSTTKWPESNYEASCEIRKLLLFPVSDVLSSTKSTKPPVLPDLSLPLLYHSVIAKSMRKRSAEHHRELKIQSADPFAYLRYIVRGLKQRIRSKINFLVR